MYIHVVHTLYTYSIVKNLFKCFFSGIPKIKNNFVVIIEYRN